jgi:hypothetical protein
MALWRFFLNNIEVEEPIGWDAVEFTAKRTEEHGIDQPFSTELTFYAKGAQILKQYYDQQFINAEVPLKIMGDTITDGVPYEFNGFVNMALYSERNVCDTDSWEITVGILDDNFRERFKSRMDVDIDIYATKDLDGNTIPEPDFDETRLHTQEVYLVGFARNLDKEYPLAPWALLYYNFNDGWKLENFSCVIPAYFSNSDFKGPFGNTRDPIQPKFTPYNACFYNNSNTTRKITFSANVKGGIQWTAVGQPGNTANIWLVVSLWYNGNFVSELAPVASANATYLGPLVEFDLTKIATDYSVPAAHYVIIQLRWGNGGNIKPGTDPDPAGPTRQIGCFVRECCLSVTEKNATEHASFAQTLKVKDFLKRLVRIITGNDNGLISDTFETNNGSGCYWNYALTNGLKIRQAKTALQAAEVCDPLAQFEQTNFKVSFKKLFDGLSSIFCLGWAFEWVDNQWKIRVETIDYFYQNQINFTANHVGQITQSAMTDKLANEVILGYDDTWKNIQVAGLWAIHTDRNYYINNRAMAEGTTNKVEILSEIIAEGYAIEFSRRLYFFQEDSGSSDRPNDYEMFIIWLNRSALTITNIQDSEYSLPPSFMESGTVILPAGSASMSSDRIQQSNSEVGALYNINITPARNAMRWWKVLGMHTFGLANPRLQYQTGQYQTQYSSIIADSTEPCQESIAGSQVFENGDIAPNLLKTEERTYLFKPIEIQFDYPQSLCDFLNLADLNPYGKVSLNSGSLSISGYIQEIANKPEDNSGGTTSFTLIASNIPDEPPIVQRAYSGAYSNAYL